MNHTLEEGRELVLRDVLHVRGILSLSIGCQDNHGRYTCNDVVAMCVC